MVSVIYQLCFGLNQRCSSMQKGNMLFMITENMNKEAINTQKRLGFFRLLVCCLSLFFSNDTCLKMLTSAKSIAISIERV